MCPDVYKHSRRTQLNNKDNIKPNDQVDKTVLKDPFAKVSLRYVFRFLATTVDQGSRRTRQNQTELLKLIRRSWKIPLRKSRCAFSRFLATTVDKRRQMTRRNQTELLRLIRCLERSLYESLVAIFQMLFQPTTVDKRRRTTRRNQTELLTLIRQSSKFPLWKSRCDVSRCSFNQPRWTNVAERQS